MANTYKLISTTTLASAASSITISSLPQTYTDLKFLCSFDTDQSGAVNTNVRFNGSTSGYYELTYLATGTGGNTYQQYSNTQVDYLGSNGTSFTANTFNNMDLTVRNYASSSQNKSFSVDVANENNASLGYHWITGGLWVNTAAINSISFSLSTGNFIQYSSVSVYGIKNS